MKTNGKWLIFGFAATLVACEDGSPDNPGDGGNPDGGSTSQDSGMNVVQGDLRIVPYLGEPTSLYPVYTRAPDYLAVFDGQQWTEHMVTDSSTLTVTVNGPGGRYGIAYGCGNSFGGVSRSMNFMFGTLSEGNFVQLEGCQDFVSLQRHPFQLNVPPEAYLASPSNGTCMTAVIGSSSWIGTCNPTNFVNLNPVEGDTNLFGVQYNDAGRVAKVLLERGFVIPDDTMGDLDFEGNFSAAPVTSTITHPTNWATQVSLVGHRYRFSVDAIKTDPQTTRTEAVPASLKTSEERYLYQGNSSDFVTGEIMLKDQAGDVTLGMPATTTPTVSVSKSNGNISATWQADPSLVSVRLTASATVSDRTVAVYLTQGWLGGQQQFPLPDYSELPNLATRFAPLNEIDFTNVRGIYYSIGWNYTLGTPVTGTEVFNLTSEIDDFPTGAHLRREQASGVATF